MPMYGDIYRPDFQAEIPEMEWMPEDEQQQPDFSPFAAALKRRFAKKPAVPAMDAGMMKGGQAAAGGVGGGGEGMSL